MRQKLIWMAIVFGAVFYILAFFVGEDTWVGEKLRLSPINDGLSNSINVVATMALGLGVINLFYVHGGNVLKRKEGWPLSIVVFATFGIVFTFMIWEKGIEATESALQARTQSALAAYRAAAEIKEPVARDQAFGALSADQMAMVREYYAYNSTYHFKPRTFYLESFINPLAATVMALLGFYITYAAYRAFRVRSLEATVMMISATIMILGTDPVGEWLSDGLNRLIGVDPGGVTLLDLPFWADFDNRVMMSGMQRGLWIGISIAIMAASLRILLGLEKGVIEVRSSGD